MTRNAIYNCRKLQLWNLNFIVWLWDVRIAFLAARQQQNVNFTMGVCNDVLAIWKCSCCNDGKANVKNSIYPSEVLTMCRVRFPSLGIHPRIYSPLMRSSIDILENNVFHPLRCIKNQEDG